MLICKKCGSPDIHVAMWANPNTNELMVDGEPLFDYNQAPKNICVQYCNICDEECEVMEVQGLVKLKPYFGGKKVKHEIVYISKLEMMVKHKNGDRELFTREDEEEAWADSNGKRWLEV